MDQQMWKGEEDESEMGSEFGEEEEDCDDSDEDSDEEEVINSFFRPDQSFFAEL